jgi:hypothetical protein
LQYPVLGHSVVNEHGGVYASIFLETVRREAKAANVPWTVLLAYVAAHEIGHLLFGPDAHTSEGVMKAHWDTRDMQAMYRNAFSFDAQHQRRLAACFAPRGADRETQLASSNR